MEDGAYEAAARPLALEQVLEVLEGRVQHDQRVAEDVLLRGLQRLYEHEVDREEAVERGEQYQAQTPQLRPPRLRIHAASLSGGSNSLKSARRAPSRSGTKVSDRAEAGPNFPAWIASV